MSKIVPPVYVDVAPVEPHRFGLFSIANMPTNGIDRIGAGVEWEPVWGGPAEGRVYACPADAPDFVTISAETNTMVSEPFVAVAAYDCKATSRPIEDAVERALLYLTAGEERAVEAEILDGQAQSTSLAGQASDVTPSAGTPVSLTEAFQLLEGNLYDTHASIPAIYLPSVLGSRAGFDGLLRREGQHLESQIGTRVAVGAGFGRRATKPEGAPDAPAGARYIFGGGRPTVYRGEVFTQPDEDSYLNRDDNDVVILAQREYVVQWSGPVFGVLVDDTACGCTNGVIT